MTELRNPDSWRKTTSHVKTTPKDEEAPPSTAEISQYRLNTATVNLNVGGQIQQILWSTLGKHPHTRLGRLASASSHDEMKELVDIYSLASNTFFFDRQPRCISGILDFYRTGTLCLPEGMCPTAVTKDLEYWGIQESEVSGCCMSRILERKEEVTMWKQEGQDDEVSGGFLRRISRILEKPQSSILAKVFAVVSSLVLVLASTVLILNTISTVQHVNMHGERMDNPRLEMVEMVCIVWFILELIIRFLVSQTKKRFLLDFLNIFDVVATVSYFVSVAILNTNKRINEADYADYEGDKNGDDLEYASDMLEAKDVSLLTTIRIMRVFRVVRFFRESRPFQCIGYVMKNSVKEIMALLLFFFFGVLFFATIAYYAETAVDDGYGGFASIPASMYWAVITMTTVGFGDVTPVSPLGKLIGSLCAVSGAFSMVIPIPFLIHSATEFYKLDADQQRISSRKNKLGGA